jgi:L-2-hydroxyglutarate oxidase LhgO
MSEQPDCIVIGAGVVGLAIARRMAMAGREVVMLEAEETFGTHTSASNSEVIHAGTYYASGSVRAKLCAPGEPVQGFTLSGPRDHGIPELVNLFGVELPGLTSSPAIADHLAEMLE